MYDLTSTSHLLKGGAERRVVVLDGSVRVLVAEVHPMKLEGFLAFEPELDTIGTEVIDSWLTVVVDKTPNLMHADLKIESVIGGNRVEFTLPRIANAQEILRKVQQSKVTIRDRVDVVLVTVGNRVGLELELGRRERPTRCTVIVREVCLPGLARFVTKFHENSRVRNNGEIMGQALSEDPNEFDGALGLMRPLPVRC